MHGRLNVLLISALVACSGCFSSEPGAPSFGVSGPPDLQVAAREVTLLGDAAVLLPFGPDVVEAEMTGNSSTIHWEVSGIEDGEFVTFVLFVPGEVGFELSILDSIVRDASGGVGTSSECQPYCLLIIAAHAPTSVRVRLAQGTDTFDAVDLPLQSVALQDLVPASLAYYYEEHFRPLGQPETFVSYNVSMASESVPSARPQGIGRAPSGLAVRMPASPGELHLSAGNALPLAGGGSYSARWDTDPPRVAQSQFAATTSVGVSAGHLFVGRAEGEIHEELVLQAAGGWRIIEFLSLTLDTSGLGDVGFADATLQRGLT